MDAMTKFSKRTIIAASAAAFAPAPAWSADDHMPSVVVTAQSRRQRLQDVPISMQVVTAKDIPNSAPKTWAT